MYPGADRTEPKGIDSSDIVGRAGGWSPGRAFPLYAFRYDGITWTRLDYPHAARTWSEDIDDGKIVGHYEEDFRG